MTETGDPFQELRGNSHAKHEQKAKMHVILTAIEEVIEERGGTKRGAVPTPTEYFGAIMIALEAADSEHAVELATLLSMVMPQVPKPVLRSRFSSIVGILANLLKSHEEGSLIRHTVSCLGTVLAAQETTADVWSRPQTLKAFHIVLSFVSDSRPKVRKAAQQALTALLSHHLENKCDALATHVASFAENVIGGCTAKDSAPALQLLSFLKEALPLLPQQVIASLTESLLRLPTLGSNILGLVTYQVISELVFNRRADLRGEYLSWLVQRLIELQPNTSEPGLASIYVKVLCTALVRLQERVASDPSSASAPTVVSLLPRVVAVTVSFFQADSSEVHRAAGSALQSAMYKCLPLALKDRTGEEEANEEEEVSPLPRVIASMQSLLSFRYQNAWQHALKVLAHLFKIMGEASKEWLSNLLLSAVQLYESVADMPGASSHTREGLLHVIGSALEAMGPENFLSIVPLQLLKDKPTEKNPRSGGVSESRAWLLPLLREHVKNCSSSSCSLQFFKEHILGIARQCENLARADSSTELESKHQQLRCMQLWATFPSFCQSCGDISQSFPSMAKLLGNAMNDQRYPELRGVICAGLQHLISRCTEKKENMDEETASSNIEEDRATLAKYAKNFLPLLFSFVEQLSDEKDPLLATLCKTVEAYAAITDPSLLNKLFKQIMQKLLEATAEINKDVEGVQGKKDENLQTMKHRAHMMMDLTACVMPYLDPERLELLYRVLKPQIKSDQDSLLQKRSYKLLLILCERHESFTMQPERLKDLLSLLSSSLLSSSVTARTFRLRCLQYIVRAMDVNDAEQMRIIPELLGEVILCNKEPNGKAREAAFELLVTMSKKVEEAGKERGGGLPEFFTMVLGSLAATTPHMRSAGVLSLSRLLFEYWNHPEIVEMSPSLLQTVQLLLQEKAREVIKSVLGFIKLAVAVVPQDKLEPLLPDLMQGLLSWIGESKNRFRTKIRYIIEKLCKKFGYDHIMDLVPEADRALVKHIKKTKEREQKQKDKGKSGNGLGSWEEEMGSDYEGDTDAEEEEAQVLQKGKGKKKAAGSWVREAASDGDVVDFLDDSVVRNVLNRNPNKRTRGGDSDSDLEVADDGRMIIPEDDDDESLKSRARSTLTALEGMSIRDGKSTKSTNGKKKRKRSEDEDEIRTVGGRSVGNKSTKSLGVKSRGGRSAVSVKQSGEDYRAKKAKGDVKKKGKFEPYAYLPLDPKLLMGKKGRKQAVNAFSKVGKLKRARK